MAFHIFLRAAITNKKIDIYGNGEQIRDFTYIDDVVNANMLSLEQGVSGNIYNIGGGSNISINETLKLIESITNKTLKISYKDTQKGDVRQTQADISESKIQLKYEPRHDITTGLENEYEWIYNNINLLT